MLYGHAPDGLSHYGMPFLNILVFAYIGHKALDNKIEINDSPQHPNAKN